MLHFLCAACERSGKQSMAATPTATFPALATRIPSAHLFTHAQFAQTTHTHAAEIKQMHTLMRAYSHARLHMQEQKEHM